MRGAGFGISKRWAEAEGPGSAPGEPVWAPLICHSSAISGQPANAPDAWVGVVLPQPVLYPFSLTLSVEICPASIWVISFLQAHCPLCRQHLSGTTERGGVGWGRWGAGAPQGGQTLGSRVLESCKAGQA